MNELDAVFWSSLALPVFQAPHNSPYYADFIEATFSKCKDLWRSIATIIPGPQPVSCNWWTACKRVGASRFVRSICGTFRQVTHWAAIYNDAWSDNWGFRAR